MRLALATVVLVLATTFSSRHTAASKVGSSQVDRLTWFSGCWQEVTRSGQIVEEQWMAPRGGQMVGMGRTVRGDSVIEYEHLRILERGGKVVYHAEPSGQAPADFTAAAVSDTMVTFENPQHDFPQRVIYRKRGADTLLARIEGTANGRTRGVDFPYARARCPGS
jgi:hypothetical protein